MADLSAFPITRRWAPEDAGVIQLYSYPTPNGIKVSVMLEETGLPYEAHRIGLDEDVRTTEFLSLNPNNKIPAIIDPHGPGDAPIGLFESGAILVYLAEKTGKFFGTGDSDRYRILQWLMFQMGGVGPMFGQVGFFLKYGGTAVTDPIPRERYLNEAIRLLGVIEGTLEGHDWIAGDYSIADMAICPWLRAIPDGYDVADLVGWDGFPRVKAYLERFLARPAVQRALDVPPR